MPEPRETLYIGIDPGKKTGIATFRAREGVLEVQPAWDFWKAYAWVRAAISEAKEEGCHIIAVVEDPRRNRPVWPRKDQNWRQMTKIAQNVGSNKRDAQLWIEAFKRLEVRVRRIKPTKRKWSKRQFKKRTGYEGQTSQHGRDAARMVFGLAPQKRKRGSVKHPVRG